MENPIESIVQRRLCEFSKSQAKAMAVKFKKTGYRFNDLAEYLVYSNPNEFKKKTTAQKMISDFNKGRFEFLSTRKINLIGNQMIAFTKEVKKQERLLNENRN